MSTLKSETTSDAVEILYRRLVKGNPETEALLAEEETRLDIAEQIFRLRTGAGLSQRELAEQIGTTASVIHRLERADYEGRSLAVLRRVAAALNRRVRVSLVPVEEETSVR